MQKFIRPREDVKNAVSDRINKPNLEERIIVLESKCKTLEELIAKLKSK